MQLQLDPAIPPNLSPEQLRDFKSFLDVALDGLTAAAGGEIFTTGNAMWTALSLIVIVLTGSKIAFSGTIQAWEIAKMVIGLWIPWVMLQFYTNNIPGMAFTFPAMLAAGGNWLHNLLIGDAVYAMQTELGNLIFSVTSNVEAQAIQGNVLGMISEGVHGMLSLIAGVLMMYFMVLLLMLLAAFTYAQVIWAQIALAILIIIGPMFIPFLVFDPLAFLFWGWFRAMITYSLYAVIAGAVLRVFSAVGLAYITSFSSASLDLRSFADMGYWMLAILPLFISGILASLKCGELASMLVTGAGAAGSGLMSMATTGASVAATGGAAAAARAGAGGLK